MATLEWRGDLAKQIAREAGLEALHTGGEAILTEADPEVPMLSKTLARSGTITDVPSEEAVYISYNTPYAVRQHEDLTFHHPHGKAKYLEDPFNRNKSKVLRLAELMVKKALKERR